MTSFLVTSAMQFSQSITQQQIGYGMDLCMWASTGRPTECIIGKSDDGKDLGHCRHQGWQGDHLLLPGRLVGAFAEKKRLQGAIDKLMKAFDGAGLLVNAPKCTYLAPKGTLELNNKKLPAQPQAEFLGADMALNHHLFFPPPHGVLWV